MGFAQANPPDDSNEADGEPTGNAMKLHELEGTHGILKQPALRQQLANGSIDGALGQARAQREPGAVEFDKVLGRQHLLQLTQ